MTTLTHQLMQAREAGRADRPCPVERGDVSADGLALFHAWHMAKVSRETGADILPDRAESEHPDLQICRPPAKEAL